MSAPVERRSGTPQAGGVTSPPGDAAPVGAPVLDAARARGFLLAAVRHRLGARHADDHEDLAQEALVRLLRVLRREPVRNLEALMNTLADRVVIQHDRRRRRWSILVQPFDPAAHDRPDPSTRAQAALGDPVHRLRFTVLEFFAAHHSPCAELARAFFARTPWEKVAAAAGLNPDAVRRRWSRCLDRLRDATRRGDGPLLEWCDD